MNRKIHEQYVMACEILQEIRGLFDSKESKNTRIGKMLEQYVMACEILQE
jgi:hypothetical protein